MAGATAGAISRCPVTCCLPLASLPLALPPCPGEAWFSPFPCEEPTHTLSLRMETGLGDSGPLFTLPAPPSTVEAGHRLRTVCGRLSPLSQEAPQAFLPPGSSCQRASPDLTVASSEDSSAPAGPCAAQSQLTSAWRAHLDAGVQSRCPDSPGQGWPAWRERECLRLLLTGQ